MILDCLLLNDGESGQAIHVLCHSTYTPVFVFILCLFCV